MYFHAISSNVKPSIRNISITHLAYITSMYVPVTGVEIIEYIRTHPFKNDVDIQPVNILTLNVPEGYKSFFLNVLRSSVLSSTVKFLRYSLRCTNCYSWGKMWFNLLLPRQNRRHFTEDVFKRRFLNENVRIWIIFHWILFLRVQLTKSTLVQIMAWRLAGDKLIAVRNCFIWSLNFEMWWSVRIIFA